VSSRIVQFVAIAEAGPLEAQAIMLCESIRLFGGRYADASITLVSPRASRRPTAHSIRAMEKLQVDYLPLDLDSPCPEYGTSFRVMGASFVEQRSKADVLIQIDSDTVFLGEPDFDLTDADMLARPVDVKGICTSGAGDVQDDYWRELCRLCGVSYDAIPWIETTVDRSMVRANYNGGLIVVRRDCGIFEKAEEIFRRIISARRHSHVCPAGPQRIGSGHVSPKGFMFWGTGQVALSLACTARNAKSVLLPPSYNIPLHFFDALRDKSLPPIHVHYHWLCDRDFMSRNPLFDGRMNLPERLTDWLRSRLPLD
jgi:hypothetical protein